MVLEQLGELTVVNSDDVEPTECQMRVARRGIVDGEEVNVGVIRPGAVRDEKEEALLRCIQERRQGPKRL